MNITWEDYQNKYNAADEPTRQLLDSEQIPELGDQIMSISPNTTTPLSEVVKMLAHNVLGNVTDAELQTWCAENKLSTELLPALQVLKGVVPKANKGEKEQLELRPEGVPRQAPPPPSAGERPLTREEVIASLSPQRTMQSDIASIEEGE